MNQPKPVSEIMQGVDLGLKSRVKEIMSVGDGIPQHKPSRALTTLQALSVTGNIVHKAMVTDDDLHRAAVLLGVQVTNLSLLKHLLLERQTELMYENDAWVEFSVRENKTFTAAESMAKTNEMLGYGHEVRKPVTWAYYCRVRQCEADRARNKGQAAQMGVVPATSFTDEEAAFFAKPIELIVDHPPVWQSLSDATTYVAIAYRIGIACTTKKDIAEVCCDRESVIYIADDGVVTEISKNKGLTREESFARTILLVPNSNVGMFPLSMATYRELKAEAQRNALTRAATAIREMDKQLQNATI